MNTKVEEAVGVVEGVVGLLSAPKWLVTAASLSQARTTIAAHLAQQDATIARMAAVLGDCSDKLNRYFKAHGPEYVGGVEHGQLQARISAALKDST